MRENQVSGVILVFFLLINIMCKVERIIADTHIISQVQEIIHLNKCKKERLFMEERDDLEQMAFIQKWNDGKAEREKKREQMWNGILEKAGIKKEEK